MGRPLAANVCSGVGVLEYDSRGLTVRSVDSFPAAALSALGRVDALQANFSPAHLQAIAVDHEMGSETSAARQHNENGEAVMAMRRIGVLYRR